MAKVQALGGFSLADTYEVKGSVAVIRELVSREVPLFHEMGQVIFSERLSGDIFRVSTGAIAQNINISSPVDSTAFPPAPFRVVALSVFADVTARLTQVAVMVRNPNRQIVPVREVPVWIWDGATYEPVRIVDDGGASANVEMLVPTASLVTLPFIMVGRAQPLEVSELVMRGVTSGFGAGTVTVTLVVYFVYADHERVGGSVGLPIPSW